jgi:tRNA (guanine37-N1)-methyltransferase
MQIDILSLFPEYFRGPFDVSILKRAKEKGLIDIRLTNIREFAEGKHKKVDDRPFGGGPGMVLKPDPLIKAIRHVKNEQSHVICLSPQGKVLTASMAQKLSEFHHLILVCGHYEGIDQRVIDAEVDEEISIGDYVLTNGCIGAIVLVDCIARFIPGVLGDEQSAQCDSFQNGGFDGPHYTTPIDFEGMSVPEVLRSGHHEHIRKWKEEQVRNKMKTIRPDLLESMRGC